MQPYKIDVPDSKVNDLKERLSRVSFPDEIQGAEWNYGVPLADMKRVTEHWKTQYDWKKHEARLNEDFSHFATDIDVDNFAKLNIHFIHHKSSDPNAIPLLFCHGWPGSFIEVTRIVNQLTDVKEGQPSFHVVAPSLPGFGFSEGSTKKGFGLAQYAEVCHKLMLQLGYTRYATQGGDWGFYITRLMDMTYATHILFTHLDTVRALPPSPIQTPLIWLQHLLTPYSDWEKEGLKQSKWFQVEGFGYNFLNSTKPQTIGYALADSPVALLAYVLEKLHDWTDGYPWTNDEICTWVSIYAFSRAGPAANVRIYYEATHADPGIKDRILSTYAPVPLGLSWYPKELFLMPHSWMRRLGPVVWEQTYESGGHFAAWERPDEIVDAVRGTCKAFQEGNFAKGGWLIGLN